VADRLAGQLAGLADRYEAGADLVRERGAEDEAARLDADDLVDLVGVAIGEELHDMTEPNAAREQRRDVAKANAGLREVRDRPDQRLEVHRGPSIRQPARRRWPVGSSPRSRMPSSEPSPWRSSVIVSPSTSITVDGDAGVCTVSTTTSTCLPNA